MCGRSLREVWEQVGSVGSTKARYGIPSSRGRVPRDGCRLIIADGDIEEVRSVFHGIGRNLVQSRIDITEIAAGDLIRDGNQARPLGRTAAGATHDIPTDTARISATATGARTSRR